jgi:hypothetical protein
MLTQDEVQRMNAEFRRVADEWVRNFQKTVAPRLVMDGEQGAYNFQKISERCLQKTGGEYLTISYLTESCNELTAEKQLYLYAEPKVLTAAEKALIDAEKAEKKMREDYRLSIQKQPVFDVKKAEKIAEGEKWVKAQGSAKNELNQVISDYECYRGPNSRDHAMSDSVRQVLRTIRVPAPKGTAIDETGRDYVLTVQWIRRVIQTLPDRPTNAQADVYAALERVKAEYAAEQEKRNKKDRNKSW